MNQENIAQNAASGAPIADKPAAPNSATDNATDNATDTGAAHNKPTKPNATRYPGSKVLTPIAAVAVYCLTQVFRAIHYVGSKVGKISAIKKTEERLAKLPPRWALASLVIPFGVWGALNVVQGFAMVTLNWPLFWAIWVAEKVIVPVMFDRMLTAVRPAASQTKIGAWIYKGYDQVTGWARDWTKYLGQKITALPVYQAISAQFGHVKRFMFDLTRPVRAQFNALAKIWRKTAKPVAAPTPVVDVGSKIAPMAEVASTVAPATIIAKTVAANLNAPAVQTDIAAQRPTPKRKAAASKASGHKL